MPRTARRTTRSGEIFVKVARTGGRVQEVSLDADKTVAAALDASGVSYTSTDRIRVNGTSAKETTTLRDGDIVTVAGKIQGGQI